MAEAIVLQRAPRPALPALGAGLALEFAAPAARFVFRGDAAAARTAGEAFGVALPTIPLRATQATQRVAIWLGPDEWFLIGDGEAPEPIAAAIEAALDGVPHALVDVSHRQVGLAATGADAARVLSAGCPLDLRLKSFPVGFATRTLFDKADIVLWRRAETAFRVEVNRSFSPWLAEAMIEASRGV